MITHKLGHIVNVASLAGHSGTNKLVDYCASKFAAVGLDEAFRVEMYVQGHSDYIKTTVVCPYYISTGMFAGVKVDLFSRSSLIWSENFHGVKSESLSFSVSFPHNSNWL